MEWQLIPPGLHHRSGLYSFFTARLIYLGQLVESTQH